MERANQFSLRNKQKYLKVDILHYAFTQGQLLQFLHKTSRAERNFLIREYQIIKNNAKVESLEGVGLMTIKVNCKLPQGEETSGVSVWDPLANRYPRAFSYENQVAIKLDYAYRLGCPFTPPADFIRILQSPSHTINFVEVSVTIEILNTQVFQVIKLLRSISNHNQRHGYEPMTLLIQNDGELTYFIEVYKILHVLLTE